MVQKFCAKICLFHDPMHTFANVIEISEKLSFCKSASCKKYGFELSDTTTIHLDGVKLVIYSIIALISFSKNHSMGMGRTHAWLN